MGLYNGSTAALHRSIAEIARSTIETAGPNAMSVHVRIPELAQQFLQPGFTATVWLHFMLLDLVLARQLFFDSLSRAVPFAHTAMLCFMCGPIGVLVSDTMNMLPSSSLVCASL